MSTKEEDDGKESKEPDYDKDEESARRKERRGSRRTRDNKSGSLNPPILFFYSL